MKTELDCSRLSRLRRRVAEALDEARHRGEPLAGAERAPGGPRSAGIIIGFRRPLPGAAGASDPCAEDESDPARGPESDSSPS